MPNSQTELINHLKSEGILKTPAIIAAFEHVDRRNFVLEKHQNEAYGDYPLPIGYDQTISQPTTVAFMLELLQPQKGEKILDVGSGSGWTTALLAHIVGESGFVWGVELVPELVSFGKANLQSWGVSNATIIQAGDTLGLPACAGRPSHAPFDKILASAAAHIIPRELIDQLCVGGKMVIPVGSSIFSIDRISENDFNKEEFVGFAFVPLRY